MPKQFMGDDQWDADAPIDESAFNKVLTATLDKIKPKIVEAIDKQTYDKTFADYLKKSYKSNDPMNMDSYFKEVKNQAKQLENRCDKCGKELKIGDWAFCPHNGYSEATNKTLDSPLISVPCKPSDTLSSKEIKPVEPGEYKMVYSYGYSIQTQTVPDQWGNMPPYGSMSAPTATQIKIAQEQKELMWKYQQQLAQQNSQSQQEYLGVAKNAVGMWQEDTFTVFSEPPREPKKVEVMEAPGKRMIKFEDPE